MPLLNWIDANWFVLLQSVGIVGSLIFTGSALRADAEARRVHNLFSLTKQHREIWSMLYEHPRLSRVLEREVDLDATPIAPEEEIFVRFIILHLSTVYRSSRANLFIGPEGLNKDIRGFFSLPIPNAVWRMSRGVQDRDFTAFVDAVLLV